MKLSAQYWALSAASALVLTAMGAAIASAQQQRPSDENHPGKAVYETYCAFCHQEEDGDAPATESIRRLSKANIKYTVELGYMRQYAKPIPKDELAQLVDWLPKDQADASAWTQRAMCPTDRRDIDLSSNVPRAST